MGKEEQNALLEAMLSTIKLIHIIIGTESTISHHVALSSCYPMAICSMTATLKPSTIIS